MDIVKRIEELDIHLTVMKLYANTYSTPIPTYIGIDGEQITDLKVLIDERLRYKKEKKNLLKKLERKEKLCNIKKVIK